MAAAKTTRKSNTSKEELLRYYRRMLLIRRFEEKAGQLYGMGLVGGFCPLYIGQAAVVVGLEAAATAGDQRIPSYRDPRLMLPARTQLVENETFAALKDAMELEGFRYVRRQDHHALPYKEYLRAKDLGIDLPEAKPTYSVGLLGGGDPPDPVEVVMPKDFALDRC